MNRAVIVNAAVARDLDSAEPPLKPCFAEEGGLSRQVGQKIRELRRQQRLSQDRLGAKAGLKRSAISRLEEGKCGKISLESLQRIARVLGCDVSILVSSREARSGWADWETGVNRFAYKVEYPSNHLAFESVIPEKSPVLIGRLHLPPVTGISPAQFNSLDQVFLIVCSGRISIREQDKEYYLKEKDSLCLRNCCGCEIYNSDPVRTAIFWIFSFNER